MVATPILLTTPFSLHCALFCLRTGGRISSFILLLLPCQGVVAGVGRVIESDLVGDHVQVLIPEDVRGIGALPDGEMTV
jgi:hypothetical protein